jgi:hypothetical protein
VEIRPPADRGPLKSVMKRDFFGQLFAFGVVLHLRANSGLAPLVEASFLPGWCLSEPNNEPDATVEIEETKGDARAEVFKIKVDRQTVEHRLVASHLARALDQIIHLKIAELSPDAVFLHAGVVVWHDKAILIPGRSMSGKSTLTRELTNAGATYYSDEFAPVLPNGHVLPYPKPLSVRKPGGDPAQMDARSLGWRENLPAVPVVTIAAVHYDPQAASSSVREISKADAVVAMLDNTVPVMRTPERCLSTVATAVRNARCLGGRRSGAAEFAGALLRGI